MKRKKFLDLIKGKSSSDLQKMVKERWDKLKILRFDLYSGKVKNVKEINSIKKDIARLITIMNQLEDKK